MKIIVETRKEMEAIKAESRYLHDIRDLREHDYDNLNGLMHIYMMPDELWVIKDEQSPAPSSRSSVPCDDYPDESD